jgi:subfamily B ATP-binding cassette protein MsbA
VTPTSPKLYRRLLTQVVQYWRMFAFSIVCMVILAATQPAIPALLKPMLDGSFIDKDLGVVQQMAALMVLVFAVRGLAAYFSAVSMAWVAGKLVFDLRSQMFDKLMSLPASYADQAQSGTLISKVTYDATQVTDAGTRVLTTIIGDTLTVIALLSWMLYIDWKLTIIAMFSAPVVMFVAYHFSVRLRDMSRHLQRMMGDVTHRIRETLDGEKVVRIFGGQTYERDRFRDSANWARRYELKFASAANATGPIAQFVISIALAVIICASAYQSTQDEITVGGFVSFLAAMVLLFPPIRRLTSVNAGLQRGLAAAESVFELIDEASEPDAGTKTVEAARGEIELRTVSFRYPGTDSRALRDIDLTMSPGEMVALVGPSGSGKTTLAHLLPRFYEPSAGKIFLDGVDTRELTLKSLRRQIAFVNQDVVLFNGTLAENIAYGDMAGASREAIMEAADAAHVTDFLKDLPDGLDAMIGERGVRLSGGQRQRLAVARAFLKDAPVLILDEATSALDNESERRVQDALEHLRHGRTTMVIAHRLSTIERADRILVMAGGKIAESGTHESLLESSGLYAGLYRFQFMRQDIDAAGGPQTPSRQDPK